MPSRISALSTGSHRAKLLAAGLGLVALLQLAAFYALCADQVRKADARDAGVQQQHAALTDCLKSSTQSTIGGCHGLQRASYSDGAPAQNLAPGAHLREAVYTLPANFSVR